jgi:hypothetical protein
MGRWVIVGNISIHNPQSAIHNPQSTIHYPYLISTIHYPLSTVHHLLIQRSSFDTHPREEFDFREDLLFDGLVLGIFATEGFGIDI